ncbi:hypothetical protein ACVMYR_29185 [Micromonospora sp. PTRAS2]
MTENINAGKTSPGETGDGRAEAFAVLAEAVEGLTADGVRPPTASEVRLEMKRRTYGGFDPNLVGFKRFRDFLMAAASEGHIGLDTSRAGDMAVLRATDADSPREPIYFVRTDLWRAFVDWDTRMLRVYDRAAGKARMIPKIPAPFEPQRYKDLRHRLEHEPAAFIEIEPVGMPTQLAWMREYVEKLRDSEFQSLLSAALDSEKPLKLFVDILRTDPEQLTRWHRELGLKVRQVVEKWRDSVAVDEQIDIERRQPGPKETQQAPQVHHGHRQEERTAAAVDFLKLLKARRFPTPAVEISPDDALTDGAELRARLHLAIDRMPLTELKMLRVPVGYLFED